MGTNEGNRTPAGTGRTWAALAIGLPAVVALLVPMPTVDLAYQVRAGAEIMAKGALPTADAWTFTVAGTPWADQQWLAQVLLAATYRLGGWELLAVLRAILLVALSALLVQTARHRGAGERTSAAMALLAFMLTAPTLALRPQLFGIEAFAVLLWIVALRERHPRVLLAAPLVVAFWANVHGSFVLAPVVLGWAWLDDVVRGRPWRASFAFLIAGCIATLATPLGVDVWAYAAGIGSSPVIAQTVSEWQHTTPFTVPGLLFYLSVAATAALVWRGRSRLAWPDALWLVAMALVAVWAVRGLAWWPAGAVSVLAIVLAKPRAAIPALGTAGGPKPAAVDLRPHRLIVSVLALSMVAALPYWRAPDPLTGRQSLLSYAPSGLASALRRIAGPGSRIYVPQTWGSWFEWAVPSASYFVDSRFELFPEAVWMDLAAIRAGGEGAARALDANHVHIVVFAAGEPVPAGAWSRVYADPDGQILLRTPGGPVAPVP